MGFIGINELTFIQTTSKMTIAGNAIDGTISSWKSQGEKSIAFSQFVDNYRILQNIIKEYKKLVLKDTVTINRVGTEIIKVDNKLFKMWRNFDGY
ncbi:MAG: hypothetical protein E7212_03000 [Clostridium sartagoforme]|nr:hypothetical protein [Clostridium sartagoforme]